MEEKGGLYSLWAQPNVCGIKLDDETSSQSLMTIGKKLRQLNFHGKGGRFWTRRSFSWTRMILIMTERGWLRFDLKLGQLTWMKRLLVGWRLSGWLWVKINHLRNEDRYNSLFRKEKKICFSQLEQWKKIKF